MADPNESTDAKPGADAPPAPRAGTVAQAAATREVKAEAAKAEAVKADAPPADPPPAYLATVSKAAQTLGMLTVNDLAGLGEEARRTPALVYDKEAHLDAGLPQRDLTVEEVVVLLRTCEAVQGLLNSGAYSAAEGLPLLPSADPARP